MKRTVVFLGLAVAAAGMGPAPAAAQGKGAEYPVRPVRIIVPQSPGASTDMTARLVAQGLSESLRQPVIVDNRPGAGSTLGTDLVAKATPDGYTLLVVASSITINPSLRKKLPYDAVRDLAPITQLSSFPNMLTVHPALPVKSVQDLIALAKAKPGELNLGSAGTGTGTHLSAELFKSLTGVQWVHVPYKGGGPSVTALLGGQVHFSFASIPSVMLHVRAGKLRGVAVTTAKRSPVLPEIPTIAESGVPGYDHGPWNGMFAPAGTSKAIVSRLNGHVAKIVHSPEAKKVLNHEGAEPVGNAPEAFGAIIKAETAKWAKVAKAAGIQPE